MLQPPFKGVSVWIRQSITPIDNVICYNPITVCSIDAIIVLYLVEIEIEYSSNTEETLQASSRLQTMLDYCGLTGCQLKAPGCASQSTSTRISISQNGQSWSVLIKDTNTVSTWIEKLCLVCSKDSNQVDIDQITFEKKGICGWIQTRHLPESSPTWYPSTDQMAGTDVFGDPSDSTQAWGIKFDHLTFDQVMFTTNNIQHFTLMAKSTFTPGNWINGE